MFCSTSAGRKRQSFHLTFTQPGLAFERFLETYYQALVSIIWNCNIHSILPGHSSPHGRASLPSFAVSHGVPAPTSAVSTTLVLVCWPEPSRALQSSPQLDHWPQGAHLQSTGHGSGCVSHGCVCTGMCKKSSCQVL